MSEKTQIPSHLFPQLKHKFGGWEGDSQGCPRGTETRESFAFCWQLLKTSLILQRTEKEHR